MIWFSNVSAKRNRQTGSRGEKEACRFLEESGFAILDRNARNAHGYAVGEIDIVAKKAERIHFVEVKTRTKTKREMLPPEMSITREKLRKLHRAIDRYRSQNREIASLPYQLDAVVIVYDLDGSLQSIRHLEHIFL
jgi:putative endonuclease